MALQCLNILRRALKRPMVTPSSLYHHLPPKPTLHQEDGEDYVCKFEAYFNRGDIDGWEVRRALDQLHGMDVVPDPKIINAALRACRRINDYALAIRCLECVRFKCGDKLPKIWPYILQEIQPTMTELGVETPEQLGYHIPELHLGSVYDL